MMIIELLDSLKLLVCQQRQNIYRYQCSAEAAFLCHCRRNFEICQNCRGGTSGAGNFWPVAGLSP